MSRLEVISFADEHLDAAGELLAARHRRHRLAEPLLPVAFEEPAAARAEVEACWRKDGAAGAVAVRGDEMVGYLVGAPADDAIWGANVWVELAGHAVDEPEVVRDLYAAVAEGWLAQGRHRHWAVVPASDTALVDAWFRLSFGQQQAYGISEVRETAWPHGVRKAEPRDVDALLELAPLLSDHQLASPVFSGRALDWTVEELRAEIEQDIESEAIANLVFELDGRVVANFEVVPVEGSSMQTSLARPERACYLGFAIVDPAARGSGAGLALTQASFAWAHEAGYETMVTDWRVTNLLASRFWPSRGFRTTFARLYRSIP
ncbi:MAG TPA: GNAT family N-acetyltransferase [Gaiellaceae bacterium]